jgi:hypothetical protein
VFCRPGGSGIRPAAQPGTQLMPTPLPSDAEVNLVPPTAEETQLVIRGVLGAVAPADGPTRLQRELFAALSHFAAHAAGRDGAFTYPCRGE